VHRLRNIIAKLPKKPELHDRVRNAYWAALDQAGSAADGEARLRALVGQLQTDYPSAGGLPGRRPAGSLRPPPLPAPAAQTTAQHQPARALAG